MKLPINEIFATVQGEGFHVGTPSIFIRLQGCDVGCGWCDTKHTWSVRAAQESSAEQMLAKRDSDERYARMDLRQILAAMQPFAARHVVITGGEPCAHDLRALTDVLIDSFDLRVQIETSATYPVSAHPKTWVTASPKIAMPGGKAVLREVLERAQEIKFPVGRQRDIDLLQSEILPHFANRERLFLQPISQSESATQLAIKAAFELGCRVSIQVHKYIGVR
jgi:7-carboxy-7-deazaguanine synthase